MFTNMWGKAKKSIKLILLKLREKYTFTKKFVDKIIYLKQKHDFSKLQSQIPINSKLILFSSYGGKSYSCNPKEIYEELLRDEAYFDYHFVWAFKSPNKYTFLKKNRNTEIIKFGGSEYQRTCCQAKYWINNYTMLPYIWPKHEQIYIQTWHGKPLKKIGADINLDIDNYTDVKTLKVRYKNDAKKMKYLLSSSDFYSECMSTAFCLSKNQKKDNIILVGYARNCFLFSYTEHDVERIKQQLGIDPSKKVILYAPTWRPRKFVKGEGFSFEEKIDFARLKKQLGDEYIILLRTHNLTSITNIPQGVLLVNEYDVNSIYIISDLMISDYSGTILDYANLKRPMIFYLYDRKEYEQNPGVYIDLDELPGPIIYKQDDLANAIVKTLDTFVYNEKYDLFNKKHNPYEGIDCAQTVIKSCIVI